jgi:CBS domain-containing protein
MGGRQVRRLPVVDREKRLVGVVSLGDLSRAAESQSGTALKEISKPAADAETAASMRRQQAG